MLQPQSEEIHIDEFYEHKESLLRACKSHYVSFIIADMSAKVGNSPKSYTAGPYGLGDGNKRGECLVQFCQEKQLILTNTQFRLPKKRQDHTHGNHQITRTRTKQIISQLTDVLEMQFKLLKPTPVWMQIQIMFFLLQKLRFN